MSRNSCYLCGIEDNTILEEKCCNTFICFYCIPKSKYCPVTGCPKRQKNSMQEIIMRRGFFDEVLVLNNHQNYRETKYGFTPLGMSIVFQDVYMTENILKHGLYDKRKREMDLAIEYDNLEIIKVLKDYDLPFNYQTPLQLQDDFPFLTFEKADQILRI